MAERARALGHESQPRRRRRVAVLVGVALVMSLASVTATVALETAWRTTHGWATWARHPTGPTHLAAWVTGPHATTRTDGRWNVYGTDLGHPILHGNDLYLVFGDTWGAGGTEGADWRSNTMARLASPDPADGFAIDDMITGPDGTAAELLPSEKLDGVQKTVIPTNGISVDGTIFLHYMSVRTWSEPGRWEVDHAGFARSDDEGRTWELVPGSELDGQGGFAQVALVDHEGWVLLYGVPAGRAGPVRLARARPADLTDPSSHEVWDGREWRAGALAAPIVPGPAGELTVRFHRHLDRWVMLTLDETMGAIVARTAPEPTGPWSAPVPITDRNDYPELYAPYLVPGADGGEDLWFTMSMFGPYQVGLMRVSAVDAGLLPPAADLVDAEA